MKDTIESPYILIESPANFPKDILKRDITYLEGVNCKVALRENRMLGKPMAISWTALGTAFTVYLTKPFFEAFLQEAAKDIYPLVKKWVITHVIDRRKHKVVTIRSSQSPDKIVEPNEHSRSISIRASIHSDVWVTVLVNDEVDDVVLADALAQVLDYLISLNKELAEGAENNAATSSEVVKPKVPLYLIMNTDKQCWELLTLQDLIARSKK